MAVPDGNRASLTYANGVVTSYTYNRMNWVTSLTNTLNETVLSSYSYPYDAFGNETNRDETDTNPFRYCGEYYDTETGTYYLRARYYDPAIGRFTQMDTHWNTANMIYGDNPQKVNERQDALGLKTYSYMPQISAIMQSGNLYVYCVNNPVAYVDPTGEIFMLVTGVIGAVVGGIVSAVYSYTTSGEVTWQAVLIGVGAGGAIGLTGGAAAGVIFAGSATASTSAVLTGMGVVGSATAGSGVFTLTQINTMLQNIEPNRVHHILLEHHAWNLVGGNSWSVVSSIISNALMYGIGVADGSSITYLYIYQGQTIVVATRVVNDVVRIVDAWVQTR